MAGLSSSLTFPLSSRPTPDLIRGSAGTHLSPFASGDAGPGSRAARSAGTTSGTAKARADAVEFEAVFLNAMFGHMFTGIDGDGPFGGAGGAGVWRSFLGEEYARSFAKAGGIGLADHVYRTLIAQQEARAA